MLDALRKLVDLKKFSELITGKKGSILGIDIGSSAIKVVQLREKKGKVVLENYAELALGPYGGVGVGQATTLTKAKTKEALVDIFREANLEGTRAVLSIPMGTTLLSLVELPKTDKKSLNAMIPLEARKYIPVPVSEVMLDWWILPPQEDSSEETDDNDKQHKGQFEKTQVLLAAIHNDTIEKYKDIRSAVEIDSSSFEIDIFSTIRSSVGRENAVVMVVDMGAATTKLAVVDFGVLRMQHIINMGSQDVTVTISKMLNVDIDEAEQIKRDKGLVGHDKSRQAMEIPLNHIAGEINKVIANYRKKHTHPISRIVLTGGGVLLNGFTEYAQRAISVPVEIGEPFARIETPVFLQDTLQEAGPEFAVAIGLAIKEAQGG